MSHLSRRTRSALNAAALGVAAALTFGVLSPTEAVPAPAGAPTPGVATSQSPTPAESAYASRTAGNPLAGRRWGNASGVLDPTVEAWNAATGEDKALLERVAQQPKTAWFGQWRAASEITGVVRSYIADAQDGDPETLVQLAVFAMPNWAGRKPCQSVPNAQEQAAYKTWIAALAEGIGDAHVAIIQQPDAPKALCAPGGSTQPSKLIAWGTKTLSALPNAAVYVEIGAADWPSDNPKLSAKLAVRNGVKWARGFAFNSTHYDSTERNVLYAEQVSQALAKRGLPGKTAVISTSQNGTPFQGKEYEKTHGKVDTCATPPAAGGKCFDHIPVCRKPGQRKVCVTLGIPPTTDVANLEWGLSAKANRSAATYVDGYLWFARPWLFMQNQPFLLDRTLDLARTWAY